MTDGVRERILDVLGAGPATVAGLAERLDAPGGVVSYHLKRLEQDGLVRVGASRTVRGSKVPAYVGTAAAQVPASPAPAPLPGLAFVGGDYPVPLWTVPPGEPLAPADGRAPGDRTTAVRGDSSSAVPEQQRAADRGPLLAQVRRVPMDDAVFHEFATRLDELAREFAARAVPGAPEAELAVTMRRPSAGIGGS